MKQLFYSGWRVLALPVWLLAGMQAGFGQAQAIAFVRQQVSPDAAQVPEKGVMQLREALKLLEGHYKVDIVFGDRIVEEFAVSAGRVILKGTVEENLSRILQSTGLKFRKIGNSSYAILARGDRRKQPVIKNQDAPEAVTPQTDMMQVLPAEDFTTPVIERKVSGRITDEKGEPLPGASILVKGTQQGMITDVEGRFSIEVPDENTVLVFSFVGYVSQEIPVGHQTTIEVVLTVDEKALEEVVVVGYGTEAKINITGAVDVIDNSLLKNRPVSNASQMLQGQSPGLNFTVGNFGFEPGASMNIQIRGQGSINGGGAYILVDNIPVEDINRINPNDIESVSVLKDAAAAAIYGARAPYGVILITTKSGSKNAKPVFSYSGNVSFAKPVRLPRMVDSYSYARAINEAGRNGGGVVYSNETIDRIIAYQNDPTLPETIPSPMNPRQWGEAQYSNANHDYFDVFYGTAIRHQNNLSVSGGSEKTSYYLSAGHVSEDGVLNFVNDFYKRYNVSARLNTDITSWWKLGFQGRYQLGLRTKPNFDNQGDYDLMFHQIARTPPMEAMKTPNGRYTRLSKIPSAKDAGQDEIENHEIWQTYSTELSLLKGWKLNADYTFRMNNELFTGNNYTAYIELVDGSLQPQPSTIPSYIEKKQANNFYQTANIFSTYDLSLNQANKISLMAGYQFESQKNRLLYGMRRDVVTSEVPSISTSTGDILVGDELSHWATSGLFFRAKYNYRQRYLVEINSRYDGTSKFSKGNRWGFFPSLSAGWNISEEDFWRPVKNTVGSLKLRGSWGRLGNQNVAAYQDMAFIGINNNLAWIINGSRSVYTTAPNLTSADLTWETSETLDYGLDFGLLQGKLSGTFDWFQRTTKNMLGPAEALPAVIGASVPRKNNASLRTRGWELSLEWKHRINNNLDYFVGGNLSDYRSVITEFYNPAGVLTTYYPNMQLGEIWGFQTEGLFLSKEEIDSHADQSFLFGNWKTGDVKYKDLNGDGKINQGANTVANPGDRRRIGNSIPRYRFGFSLGLNYRNFDFSMFWVGTGKRDLNLTGNIFWGFDIQGQTTLFPHHLDYYRDVESEKYIGLGTNTGAYYPRPYLTGERLKNNQVQSRYLQNGAFARLKNMQVGYTLSSQALTKIKLTNLRIFVSGENLWTLSSLPIGFDPETSIESAGWGAGKSHLAQAMFALGLNVGF